jgi:hypothetical protein
MSKEAKEGAKSLFTRCKAQGIRFPKTKSEKECIMECGVVLLAHRKEDGSCDQDAAFNKLKIKYGLQEDAAEVNNDADTDAQPKKRKPATQDEAIDPEDTESTLKKARKRSKVEGTDGKSSETKARKPKAKPTVCPVRCCASASSLWGGAGTSFVCGE